MTRKARTITFVGILMAAVLLPLAVYAAPPPPPPPLPPPPEPTSAPRPAPTGGLIELHVQLPEWLPYQWQELWTVVQWQDEWGRWRDVEGWQGTLDHVTTGENGEIVGKGTWWVAKADLGKGPFRWVVYRSQGGRRLATSESFDLPANVRQVVLIEVTVQP